MSKYREVQFFDKCPCCGENQEWIFCLRYGFLWGRKEYKIGDVVEWDDDYEEENEEVNGRTKQMGEWPFRPCSKCGKEDFWAVIYIENNTFLHGKVYQSQFDPETGFLRAEALTDQSWYVDAPEATYVKNN